MQIEIRGLTFELPGITVHLPSQYKFLIYGMDVGEHRVVPGHRMTCVIHMCSFDSDGIEAVHLTITDVLVIEGPLSAIDERVIKNMPRAVATREGIMRFSESFGDVLPV